MVATPSPRPVGWCDEHGRYFYWGHGCSPTSPKPPGADVRAWYQQRPHQARPRVTDARIPTAVTNPASLTDADDVLPLRSVAVRSAIAFGEWPAR